MHYLFYRIEESNGFIAYRCLAKAYWLVASLYGRCFLKGRQIILPDIIFKQVK